MESQFDRAGPVQVALPQEPRGEPFGATSPPLQQWRAGEGQGGAMINKGPAGLHEAVWQMSQLGLGLPLERPTLPPGGMAAPSGVAEGGPYPERPGEAECTYFMRTGQCGYGMACRYHHPSSRSLPEAEEYPERPGQPDCQYYLKTGRCKFGAACKYHHAREKAGITGRVHLSPFGLPIRPSEKDCAFYMRTGTCKYGVTCKFNHPVTTIAPPTTAGFAGGVNIPTQVGGVALPIPSPLTLSSPWPPRGGPRTLALGGYIVNPSGQPGGGLTQGLGLYPSFPVRAPQGYSEGAGFSLPFMFAASPPGSVPDLLAPLSGYPSYPPVQLGAPPAVLSPTSPKPEAVFPERPGQPECQYYVKTGDCKYGATCRYDHPKNRAAPPPTCQLSPMGLPLRPDAPVCTFYKRNGICKFGMACKFDHPMTELSHSSTPALAEDFGTTESVADEGTAQMPSSTRSDGQELSTQPATAPSQQPDEGRADEA